MHRILGAALLLVTACAGQTPPAREPLPDVAAEVPPPAPCAFVLGEGSGVEIEEVMDGTPAEGVLARGDLVTAVDGRPVTSTAALRAVLDERRPGEVVRIEVAGGDGREERSLTLAANPQDEGRPLIGVLIATRYDEVPLDEVPEGDGLTSPLSRLVEVEGRLHALDPVAGVAVRTPLEPGGEPWFGAGGVVYHLEGDVDAGADLMGSDGRRVPLDPDLAPLRLIGSVAGDLLLAAFAETVQTPAALRLDPASGTVRWAYVAPPELGLPVGATASPDGGRIAFALAAPEEERLAFAVVEATAARPIVEGIEQLEGGNVFGWFDDARLLVQPPDAALALLTLDSGELEPVALPVENVQGVRVFPVGDGRHLLVQQGGRLLRSGVEEGVETRELVARCEIGLIDQIGSGLAPGV